MNWKAFAEKMWGKPEETGPSEQKAQDFNMGDYLSIGGGSGSCSTSGITGITSASYPQWVPYSPPTPSVSYQHTRQLMDQKALYERMMKAMQQDMVRQEQEAQKARQTMSKQELMRGILKEVQEMKTRMDELDMGRDL